MIASIGRRGLHRVFDHSVLERLALIAIGRSAGFSLDEISLMFAPDGLPRLEPFEHDQGSLREARLSLGFARSFSAIGVTFQALHCCASLCSASPSIRTAFQSSRKIAPSFL